MHLLCANIHKCRKKCAMLKKVKRSDSLWVPPAHHTLAEILGCTFGMGLESPFFQDPLTLPSFFVVFFFLTASLKSKILHLIKQFRLSLMLSLKSLFIYFLPISSPILWGICHGIVTFAIKLHEYCCCFFTAG